MGVDKDSIFAVRCLIYHHIPYTDSLLIVSVIMFDVTDCPSDCGCSLSTQHSCGAQ
jgi:hypothetical protein